MLEPAPVTIHSPKCDRIPIVISCPHAGIFVPDSIAEKMTKEALQLPDTDWFVHELYAFAPALGVTLVEANYSRYVIDLNRNPLGDRLYSDQRIETKLVPTATFSGVSIYQKELPDKKEIDRRIQDYYLPYHFSLSEIIKDLRRDFHHVLLFEAHSIKRLVPLIRAKPFADVIVGDQEGKTASPVLISTALLQLKEFDVAHNDPFMGGHITRTFGNPVAGIHALQLEMSQDLYMDDEKICRDQIKQERVQEALKKLILSLAQCLAAL